MDTSPPRTKQMSRFRILSIDGGGIKGVFPASFLASIEDNLEHPVREYFDLITGTSTGGIIALGLGFGLSAKQLAQFYIERGPTIFPPDARTLLGLFKAFIRGHKYESTALRASLYEVFGDATLGDSKTRLVIPTLNAASGAIHVYKTPHHPKLEMDHKVKMVDVAMSTSAAPTYLPSYVSPVGIPFLDGGLWANNPTGMAVVEAIAMLGVDRNEIEVLSIGCTEEPQDFTKVRNILFWGRAAIEAAMSGQSFASMGTAYLLAGHEHVTRINPPVAPGRFKLDDTSGIDHLRAFGYEEARYAIPKLREKFFAETVKPFEPLRGRGCGAVEAQLRRKEESL